MVTVVMRAPPLPLWRMPRARYERLIAAGAFGPEDSVGLLDGRLVVREPRGGRRAAGVGLARAAAARRR
jgi:hypothetical protein